jgi:hypothetical protein
LFKLNALKLEGALGQISKTRTIRYAREKEKLQMIQRLGACGFNLELHP